jgi:hypothetical protein
MDSSCSARSRRPSASALRSRHQGLPGHRLAGDQQLLEWKGIEATVELVKARTRGDRRRQLEDRAAAHLLRNASLDPAANVDELLQERADLVMRQAALLVEHLRALPMVSGRCSAGCPPAIAAGGGSRQRAQRARHATTAAGFLG